LSAAAHDLVSVDINPAFPAGRDPRWRRAVSRGVASGKRGTRVPAGPARWGRARRIGLGWRIRYLPGALFLRVSRIFRVDPPAGPAAGAAGAAGTAGASQPGRSRLPPGDRPEPDRRLNGQTAGQARVVTSGIPPAGPDPRSSGGLIRGAGAAANGTGSRYRGPRSSHSAGYHPRSPPVTAVTRDARTRGGIPTGGNAWKGGETRGVRERAGGRRAGRRRYRW
jgi:hypothetical protein